MPLIPSSQAYRVEYFCTANPRRPVWREDAETAGTFSLQRAIERARAIAAAGRPARVLDEADTVVFYIGQPLAA